MKFLVFGFSVTAESDGYVERCAALCASAHPDHEVTKVAIGGLQPDHARHLVEDIVSKHKPDALIIEIATAVYRLRPENPAQIADHTAGMEALFEICRRRGMHCGILDLPLTGVQPDRDWMAATDAGLSARYRVPHRVVPLTEGTLRDNVHPNDAGKDMYAAALFDLIEEVAATPPDFSALKSRRQFGAYAISDVSVPGGVYRDFSRAGFREKMLSIPEGGTAEIQLPDRVSITGLIMLMGPTSGTFLIRMGEVGDRMHCYDRHCYYERVGGKPLKPTVSDRITIFQDSALPPEELLKGDKDHGPRAGGITHILYETAVPGSDRA
ncbi:SGNH/GDSL hydrolase family protein [Puniceibacterium confluentis]|uniref:SGNH/GDSL hydrolase family protein n=1 Tax=Puniceibacterium confluentis TaxID=1958944 RepID=UPI0011B809CE|nr:SGNH/GDSL hydrolase family protein [Puniceibacterium confluentis]